MKVFVLVIVNENNNSQRWRDTSDLQNEFRAGGVHNVYFMSYKNIGLNYLF